MPDTVHCSPKPKVHDTVSEILGSSSNPADSSRIHMGNQTVPHSVTIGGTDQLKPESHDLDDAFNFLFCFKVKPVKCLHLTAGSTTSLLFTYRALSNIKQM